MLGWWNQPEKVRLLPLKNSTYKSLLKKIDKDNKKKGIKAPDAEAADSSVYDSDEELPLPEKLMSK